MRKLWSNLALSALIGGLIVMAGVSRADDTDIYFSGAAGGKTPLVMFSLDVRPSTGNAGQVNCPGPAITSGTCMNYFYTALPEDICLPGAFNGCLTQADADAGKVASVTDFFTYLRLSLAKALKDFQGKQLRVGLMLPQNDGTSCTTTTCNNTSGTTDGGFISLGFNELAANVYVPASLTAPATNVTAQQAIDAQLKAIANVRTNSNYAAKYKPANMYFELFRYLRGGGVWMGHNGWTTWDNNKGGLPASNSRPEHCTNYQMPFGTAPGQATAGTGNSLFDRRSITCWDSSIETPTGTGAPTTAAYISPLGNNPLCNTVTVINFMNGSVQQDADSNNAIALSVANGGMALPNISGALNVVDAMNKAVSQHPDYNIPNVKSYFLSSNQAGPEAPSLAAAGGTNTNINVQSGDPSTNPGYVVDILTSLLQQILSVSTTFVATAVPVNAFNKAQVLDNAYLALFKPDDSAEARWNGTLKKLKIQHGAFVDSLGQSGPLVISTDGRIAPGALTFWTNRPALPVSGFDPSEATATTDGRAVDRGGAGQKIPGYLAAGSNTKPSPGDTNATDFRKLFYDSGSSLVAFNVDTSASPSYPSALKTALGTDVGTCVIASVTLPTQDQCTSQLIRWIRGQDVGVPTSWKGLTLGTTTTTAPYPPRPWLLGDPLHSRPLPMNYGAPASSGYSATNPSVYIAMAGNDGMLHFFRNTTGAGAESGEEMWAFMPTTTMGIQKTLAADSVTSPVSHGPYGLDGTPIAWLNDGGDGTIEPSPTSATNSAYLYQTMRRGGRNIYSLNVTNPTTPAFQWSISPTAGLCNSSSCPVSGSAVNFAEMGLSFSTPSLGLIRAAGVNGGAPFMALFYGGGYSTNKDTHAVGTNDTIGNAIYVVNATTGELVWKAIKGGTTGPVSGSSTNTGFTHVGLNDSIPAAVTAVDTDGDGLIDRVMTADTGGNVWRVDIPGSDRGQWVLSRVAKLGRWFADANGNSTKADDRRFFYPPDVVQTVAFDGTRYDAYPIGSGDREDPLDKGGVTTNFFYAIRDNCTDILSWSVVASAPAGHCSLRYPILHSQIDDVTSDCLQNQANSVANLTTCGVTNQLSFGWKFQLNHPTGEKSLAEARTFFNTVFFTTYVPTLTGGAQCAAPKEGRGFQYAIALSNGTASFDNANASSVGSPSDATDRSYELASGGIPAQDVILPTADGLFLLTPAQDLTPPPGNTRLRTYWQRVEEAPP